MRGAVLSDSERHHQRFDAKNRVQDSLATTQSGGHEEKAASIGAGRGRRTSSPRSRSPRRRPCRAHASPRATSRGRRSTAVTGRAALVRSRHLTRSRSRRRVRGSPRILRRVASPSSPSPAGRRGYESTASAWCSCSATPRDGPVSRPRRR